MADDVDLCLGGGSFRDPAGLHVLLRAARQAASDGVEGGERAQFDGAAEEPEPADAEKPDRDSVSNGADP
ncbi:hypothetical protein QFZ66_005013 [Streptomyces sp. B4I13]|uniref:hypothetical protein n=1 Tax=Streptomyces sp. B4I13 TaxID=3042271 RepID=UPI00278A5FA8|nr:hypothetical protein [Streptomyces sp. B4I13]MDQ0961135.1 hypothetical protein [Streptomyces sp. B4I13]